MKEKFDPSVIIFSVIFIALFNLVGNRLFEDTHFPVWFKWTGWIYLFTCYALGLWTPLVYWRRDHEKAPSRLTATVLTLSNISLGLVSTLMVLVLLRDLVWFCTRWGWLYGNTPSLVILGMTYFFLLLGAYLALKVPAVCPVPLHFPELPENFDGFKIVQISDLHISPITRRQFVRKVVNQVNALKPDMIAITGDLCDGDPKHLAEHFEPLRNLAAHDGIYFVTGNHEYYWNHNEVIRTVALLGIRVLYNENIKIERDGKFITLAGVSDHNSKKIAPLTALGCQPGKALAGTQKDFTVLLSHHPKVVLEAAKYKVNLQLSGHTHGGQFYPWNYLSKIIHGYYKGLNHHQGVSLYISKGTGYWGPPNRLGATSEITLITLYSNPSP